MNKKLINLIKTGSMLLLLTSCSSNTKESSYVSLENSSNVSDSSSFSVFNSNEKEEMEIEYSTRRFYICNVSYNFSDFFQVKINGKYVTFEQVDCSFTVAEGYEDVVEIRGKSFIVFGGGEFKINVRFADKTAIMAGTAVTQKEVDFYNSSYGADDQYTVYKLEGDMKKPDFKRWMLHNPDYILIDGKNMSSGSAPENLIGGGFIKLRNNKTYKFNYCMENLYTGNNHIDIFEETTDIFDNPLNSYFNIPVSALSIERRTRTEDGYVLTLSRADGKYDFDAETNIFKSNKLDTMMFDGITYVPYSVAFDKSLNRQDEIVWTMEINYALESNPNVKVEGKKAYFAIDFHKDNAKIPELDNYIKVGLLPEEN